MRRKQPSKEEEWQPTQKAVIAALRLNCLKWRAFPTMFQVFFIPFLFFFRPYNVSGFHQRYRSISSTLK